MTPRALWQVSVAASREAEDAVSEWLESTFAQPACSYRDVESRLTTVAVWLGKRPDWSRARRLELAGGLRQIRACGLNLGPGRLRLAKVRAQNWAQSWKRHFRPLTIGSALLLKPSWSRRRPRKGQAVVVLDPGLSFGTGHHPTTAFCLEQLVARRRRPGQSFLDAGFGSGILAIAAAKLGYAPIEGLDWDAEAIGVARANARRNRVSAGVRFRLQDLARLPRRPTRQYSLVCANLTADLLLAHRQGLIARVEPGGVLVLAGILKTEFPKLRQAFEAAGLGLAASRAAGEWRSGAFCRPCKTA
jgi:ribosomal protein L11 methyltransferase